MCLGNFFVGFRGGVGVKGFGVQGCGFSGLRGFVIELRGLRCPEGSRCRNRVVVGRKYYLPIVHYSLEFLIIVVVHCTPKPNFNFKGPYITVLRLLAVQVQLLACGVGGWDFLPGFC